MLWVLAKALQALFLLVLRALALRRSHTGAVLWVDTCLAKRKIKCSGPWQKRKLIAPPASMAIKFVPLRYEEPLYDMSLMSYRR